MKSRLLAALLLILLLGAVAIGWLRASPAGDNAAAAPAMDLAAYPWFYLRTESPPEADETLVELIAVGDIMLGRGVAKIDADPFGLVAPWLAPADLVLGNLEAVIVDDAAPAARPANKPEAYILHAPPEAAGQLRHAGFDLLGLANNHALDYGPAGLAEAVTRLQEEGLEVTGLAGTPDGPAVPTFRQINGLRLAFLAFNAVREPETGSLMNRLFADGLWPAQWDRAAAVEAVAKIRPQVDALIVSMHWGYEYALWPDPAQRAKAQALLEAGADVVIGHHPHVVQPVDSGPSGLVAYSLGNFVFDQGQGETGYGLALRLFLDHHGLRAVQGLPLKAGPQPHLLPLEEAGSLLARITPPPRRQGFACNASGCRPAEVDQAPLSGTFWAGQIDLTGDGRPETVRRAGEQVTIYSKGQVVWQSPSGWRVADLALGDPNDDGRGELLLAIWQRDAAGYERSQPYVVGYRGGSYKLLWGGRAVIDPIQEVELGDVTGDGAQELIVVEEDWDGRGRAVAVWQWTGWSFSLLWRSHHAPFQDLALLPNPIGGQPLVTVALNTQTLATNP